MSLMGWDAFCECHSRPFLIQAQLAAGAPEGWLDSLPRFIRSMGLKGNFSLCRGNECVRAAFELEADAKQVVRALGAKDLGPGDAVGWSMEAHAGLGGSRECHEANFGLQVFAQPDRRERDDVCGQDFACSALPNELRATNPRRSVGS